MSHVFFLHNQEKTEHYRQRTPRDHCLWPHPVILIKVRRLPKCWSRYLVESHNSKNVYGRLWIPRTIGAHFCLGVVHFRTYLCSLCSTPSQTDVWERISCSIRCGISYMCHTLVTRVGRLLASEYLSIFVVLQMIESREIWTVPPVVVVLVCGPRSCFQTETVQSDTVTIPRGIYRQGRSDLENDWRKSHNLLLSTLNRFWTS